MPLGMTIPILIVVLALLLCIFKFCELDERTSTTPPALRSSSPPGKNTPPLAPKPGNNDSSSSSPATSTSNATKQSNRSNSTIDTVKAEQQALAEAEIDIVTKDAVAEAEKVREDASGAGPGTAGHLKSPLPGLDITSNTSSCMGANNSVTATGGPGGPDSFCGWSAYTLERQWVRDIICSNLKKEDYK